MSDTVDIEKRNFNGANAFFDYLNKIDKENMMPISKPSIEKFFEKDAQLVCFSSKNQTSLKNYHEVLLKQVKDELNNSSGVIILYQTPLLYPLMQLSCLRDEVMNLGLEDKWHMTTSYVNETLYCVDFVLDI